MKSHFLAITVAFAALFVATLAMSPEPEPDLKRFQHATVKIATVAEDGTKLTHCAGVYIGDHRVLTAGHCVNYAKESETASLYVTTYGSDERIKAEPLRFTLTRDADNLPYSDLGLIKLERDIDVPAPRVSCDRPEIGDEVHAVGMPAHLKWTVTSGTVTTWVSRGDLPHGRWLQMDITIIGGNSGGPVFNNDGEIIGIVSHVLSKFGGRIPTNHGYAVSGPIICEFLDNDDASKGDKSGAEKAH